MKALGELEKKWTSRIIRLLVCLERRLKNINETASCIFYYAGRAIIRNEAYFL